MSLPTLSAPASALLLVAKGVIFHLPTATVIIVIPIWMQYPSINLYCGCGLHLPHPSIPNVGGRVTRRLVSDDVIIIDRTSAKQHNMT